MGGTRITAYSLSAPLPPLSALPPLSPLLPLTSPSLPPPSPPDKVSPQLDIGPGVRLVGFLDVMKLEIKHSGLSQFPRRRELPHQMISSVEVELYLTHKLYPDPLISIWQLLSQHATAVYWGSKYSLDGQCMLALETHYAYSCVFYWNIASMHVYTQN